REPSVVRCVRTAPSVRPPRRPETASVALARAYVSAQTLQTRSPPASSFAIVSSFGGCIPIPSFRRHRPSVKGSRTGRRVCWPLVGPAQHVCVPSGVQPSAAAAQEVSRPPRAGTSGHPRRRGGSAPGAARCRRCGRGRGARPPSPACGPAAPGAAGCSAGRAAALRRPQARRWRAGQRGVRRTRAGAGRGPLDRCLLGGQLREGSERVLGRERLGESVFLLDGQVARPMGPTHDGW
ncbi:MAG: hypothetical protein JWP46_4315, partial [Modestobacter sp.]|nr:hypothetical protein [Modestobacter sp.]